jgi:hypothetical protein
MKSKSSLVLLAGLVAALGAGCASQPPTVGQLMIEQSQGTKELGEQWKAGQKRVAIGESVIAEGKDTIAKGDARVKQGERMIAEGKKMMEEAELIFQTRFPGQSLDGLK